MKAAPTVSVQPNELVFKDKEQYLVTGRTDDGTLVYSMSKDGEYSEKVPTGKDTGTYAVWYKVIGDENHSNSEPQSLEAVIRSIESISIGSYPTKTTILEGMPFDASGLTVIADCGNGETFEATGYTLSGYDTSVVGEQTVTVTYGGHTAEFTVTVLERPVPTGTVETPLIEVAEFYGGKRAIISCATEGAEIYYTTDGTDPTINSQKYTVPFELTSPADIKAIAVKADMDDSGIEEQLVDVEKVAAPMASVKGEVEVGTAVKLLCTTPDDRLRGVHA